MGTLLLKITINKNSRIRMFLLLLQFMLMNLCLFMAGCSNPGDGKNSSKTGGTSIPKDKNQQAQPKLVNLAADEIQPLINRYKGKKAVLINVWATWCGPCVEEFPHIVTLGEKYSDRLKVIFISADFADDRQRAIQFLKEQGVTYTTYFKSGKDQPFIEALSEDWSGALPFTKLLAKDGTKVVSWENSADFDTFEKNILKTINH